MNSFNIFDTIIVICGLYMAFCGVRMKAENKINTSLVLSKNVKPEQIRDKDGFIKYMWIRLVICGVACVLAGVVNLLFTRYQPSLIIEAAANAVFVIILISFGVIAVKAQKKFM